MTKNILYICLAGIAGIFLRTKGILHLCRDRRTLFRTSGLEGAAWTSAEPETLNHKLDFPFKETGKEIRTDISRIFTETLHGQTLSVCSLPLPETHPINPGNIT